MSECLNFSSSMTGSTNLGPLQPQENSSPTPSQPSSLERPPIALANNLARRDRSQARRKMTPFPANSQQIQLTPLWEHVVRTRRFPPEIDTRLTFVEISERLRDPEWEVRQHALRVLMDVLPTLSADVVDKVMQPVVPELINNLGHPAPAVRKGALDTLRVYLVHSENRDEMIKAILQDGLNRSEARDAYQTNVVTGVILSAPSILFPTAKSFRPTVQVLKETTTALTSRLGQVPHQEAVVKSLMKIRGIVGPEEFDGYLADDDESLKRNIEILSKVYNVKPGRRAQSRNSFDDRVKDKNGNRIVDDEDFCHDRTWDSDSDTSGIAEEEDEVLNGSTGAGMPGARVVLETEIKFNEETAITMTILEEKDDDDETDNEEEEEDEQDDESGTDVRNDAETVDLADNSTNERRKTPRRVHFGGEVVKLRTPDSDDTEPAEVVNRKTRIPLPVSPATNMSERLHRRPSSQPCSPHLGKQRVRRASRSASNSPKREVHTHSADLSPTKGILTRTNSPTFVVEAQKDVAESVVLADAGERVAPREETADNEAAALSNDKDTEQMSTVSKQAEVFGKEELSLVSMIVKSAEDDPRKQDASVGSSVGSTVDDIDEQVNSEVEVSGRPSRTRSESGQGQIAAAKGVEEKSSAKASQRNSARGKGRNFESFPRQERNYILMELSSPERKAFKEKANDSEPGGARGNSEPAKSDTRATDTTNLHSNESENRAKKDSSSIIAASGADSLLREKVEGCREGVQGATCECPSDVCGVGDRLTKTRASNVIDVSRDRGSGKSVGDDRGRMKQGGDGRASVRNDRDKENEASVEGSGSVTCSSSEGESNPQEPSWEELGLVGQDVLDDLHNKEDWRVRVRGLERVASALRTSSALIAIEPRLGSLLHAVLGCERSCRVAAAGLAVAKVVVAGVTEDALKRRLPQLAWGLARQGGPNAAQLARIAMLRLRPALFLEQLLQPQCLGAKNAKTRENALQLLIFSLVTFPSTEFKVQTVAHKVASMVADRRRRVRQAALDTLAVLAQIYESEEVLKAGKKAAAGRHDKEAMICAIRARLSRKSLPLVSADGLVVYGLQISPAVQIATGPDVDWIVAGSGSVSPGTGRTRGQIIATAAGTERGRFSRNENTRHRDNPWTERANLVALGVGLRSTTTEQPVAWQIVPNRHEDEPRCSDDLHPSEDRNTDIEIRNGRYSENYLRLEDQLQIFQGRESESTNYQEIVDSNIEDRTSSRNVLRSSKEKNRRGNCTFSQEPASLRVESRIPILFLRDRPSDTNTTGQTRIKAVNTEFGIPRSKAKEFNTIGSGLESRVDREGSYTVWLQRRKRMHQEASVDPTAGQLTNPSFDPHYTNYRSISRSRNSQERFALDDRSALRSESRASRSTRPPSTFAEDRKRPLSRNAPQQGFSVYEPYGSSYHRQKRAIEGQFRALRAAAGPFTGNYQQYQDVNALGTQTGTERKTRDASSQKVNDVEKVSSDAQTVGSFVSRKRAESPYRRRLRSLSPSQLYHQKQLTRLDRNESHTVSMYAIDKAAVNEEEYNERNRQHYASQEDGYQIHSINKERAEYQEEGHVKSANSLLDISLNNRQQNVVQSAICQRGYSNSSRSSTPQSRDAEKAFDVITQHASSQGQDTVDSYIIPLETEQVEATLESTNTSTEEDTTKEWSSEEEVKPKSRLGSVVDDVFGSIEENDSGSVESDDLPMEPEELESRRRRSIISIISSEKILSNQMLDDSSESIHSSGSSNQDGQSISSAKIIESPPKVESVSCGQTPDLISKSLEAPKSPTQISLDSSSLHKSLSPEGETSSNSIEERIGSSTLPTDNASAQSLDIESRRESIRRDSPAILIASRPHSMETTTMVEDSETFESDVTPTVTDNVQTSAEESSVIDAAEAEAARAVAFSMIPLVADGLAILNDDKDSVNETNAEPGILKIEPSTSVAVNEGARKMPSKVPRSTVRFRANSIRSLDQSSDRNVGKPKPQVQQCFTQLESKDWEVTLKGLKALSQITKQNPEYLDACATGTIGRLLGRHIKSLRSQVSRAACMASGDIFCSQVRGIDQELDDIASALLHRTADTNRFLRADSNAALDLMTEHLPPQKTIGIIVHRGAGHQNAIVRAATARLLSNIVDRVGPDQAMTLPRDVREKLLNTGARLLIDGNLDARNQAKKMFRRLTICDGFQRALIEAVPDTTLRHIEKTLKSL